MGLTILGVRHHSPACARLVGRTIALRKPGLVLIEGPADMNGRIGELHLPHELPIAIFSYLADSHHSHSSWSPFCAHSPEWVAMRAAEEVGAAVRFMDLPAWHPAFWGVRNRYADRPGRAERIAARLCARFGASDVDALWDHLFEQPLSPEELEARLRSYFIELRGDEEADERDGPREAFMARCLEAAVREAGEVVAVCGGWHAPALEGTARAPENASWPEPPSPPEGSRVGSYLVAFSFHRLDSFTGYESGMPSPAYQDASFRDGPERAADLLLERTIERLRRRKQSVSPADVIAVSVMAEGLRRMRGHAAVSRIDLLDGLSSGLLKDALDVPLPWTYRGTILPRTDPLLVEIMAAFSGDRVGRLAPGTPHPPLIEDVRAELERHDIVPTRAPRTVNLALAELEDLHRSRILHRLAVLRIPGFLRERGPTWATEGEIHEIWVLVHRLEAEGALIEAAAYGATLEAAAAARLEAELLGAGGRLSRIADLLSAATFVGLDSLAARILSDVARSVGAEPSLAELGAALTELLGLFRHDALLGVAGAPALGEVIQAAFERGLWLFEGIVGNTLSADEGQLRAVLALRDTLRHAEEALGLDRARAHSVMLRRSSDAEAPPALRGAALGFLWSTGYYENDDAGSDAGAAAVRRASLPSTIGDFLAGLFLLAREPILRSPGLIAAVDSALEEMEHDQFLVSLPALRLAFAFFPPAEKEVLARQALALHGGDPATARTFLRAEVAPQIVARGMALEAEVSRIARRYGLHEEAE